MKHQQLLNWLNLALAILTLALLVSVAFFQGDKFALCPSIQKREHAPHHTPANGRPWLALATRTHCELKPHPRRSFRIAERNLGQRPTTEKGR